MAPRASSTPPSRPSLKSSGYAIGCRRRSVAFAPSLQSLLCRYILSRDVYLSTYLHQSRCDAALLSIPDAGYTTVLTKLLPNASRARLVLSHFVVRSRQIVWLPFYLFAPSLFMEASCHVELFNYLFNWIFMLSFLRRIPIRYLST